MLQFCVSLSLQTLRVFLWHSSLRPTFHASRSPFLQDINVTENKSLKGFQRQEITSMRLCPTVHFESGQQRHWSCFGVDSVPFCDKLTESMRLKNILALKTCFKSWVLSIVCFAISFFYPLYQIRCCVVNVCLFFKWCFHVILLKVKYLPQSSCTTESLNILKTQIWLLTN